MTYSPSTCSSTQTFQDLDVWKKAHQFVLAVYPFTRQFPGTELQGLTGQLKRAAISIPASIAEGFSQQTVSEQARLLNLAQGALEECRYYLILANDLKYGNSQALSQQLEEVSRLLKAYRRHQSN